MSIKWIPEFGERTATGIDDFMRLEHLITDEDRLVVKNVRKFLEKEVMPHEKELDDYWDWPLVKEKREFIDRIRKVLYIGDNPSRRSWPQPEGERGMDEGVRAEDDGRQDISGQLFDNRATCRRVDRGRARHTWQVYRNDLQVEGWGMGDKWT